MARAVTAILFFIGIAAFIYSRVHTEGQTPPLLSDLLATGGGQPPAYRTQHGDARQTDYARIAKSALSEQTRFHGATVNREYVHVQHIEQTRLWFTSDATITVRYAVEYSFGYDLSPSTFSVSGDDAEISVALRKPILAAPPAVMILSHSIPATGLLIDEKEAVIALHQRLYAMSEAQGVTLASDEGVIAVCERRLTAFLRDVLSKHPDATASPAIRIVYR